jgi:hypothetical protein
MNRRSQWSLLRDTFLAKKSAELSVLSTHKFVLIFLIVTYYLTGVITNILHYYTVNRPAMWDFGFESIAEVNYDVLWIISVFTRLALYVLTIYAVAKFYTLNRRVYLATLFYKFSSIVVVVSVIRVFTLLSTQLPPPNPVCKGFSEKEGVSELSMTAAQAIKSFLPWMIPSPFSIIPRDECGGDHTFSLHTIGFMICALIALKYTSNRLQFAIPFLAGVNMFLLVMMKLNYSLDVWVGFFTTLFFFLFLDANSKDLFGNYLPEELSAPSTKQRKAPARNIPRGDDLL